MEDITFVYDKECEHYTDECNECMDFVIRNLPGVIILNEEGRLVQAIAIGNAARAIRMLYDCDMVCLWENKTIAAVEAMFES